MAGPIEYLAPGNSWVTAWAMTWAVEWRSTWRPASVSLGDDGDPVVVGQRALEVDLVAVDRRRDGGLGQALADRRRHVTRRSCRRGTRARNRRGG